MNTLMNLVKSSSVRRGARGRVGASGGIGASLLPTLDPLAGLWPVNSSYSVGSAGGLTQGLQQARDPGIIAKI